MKRYTLNYSCYVILFPVLQYPLTRLCGFHIGSARLWPLLTVIITNIKCWSIGQCNNPPHLCSAVQIPCRLASPACHCSFLACIKKYTNQAQQLFTLPVQQQQTTPKAAFTKQTLTSGVLLCCTSFRGRSKQGFGVTVQFLQDTDGAFCNSEQNVSASD